MADARGGPRTPTPGTSYPNRRDLATQPAQAPKGQDYGERGKTMERQRIQPVAGAPTTPTASPTASPSGNPLQQAMTGMEPGSVPTLMDPSARPNEPVTAGLSSGPGPGREGLTAGTFGPQELSLLRGMYRKYPQFPALRAMIEQLEANL